MSDPDVVIGVDVAVARPSTAVAVRIGRAAVVEWMEADHRSRDEVDALLAWVARHDPAVVTIDAPQAYRRPARQSPAAHQRACDRELMTRRIRLYPVPTREAVERGAARLPDWMKVGFDYFKRLRRAGFEVPDEAVMPGALGGPPAVLEAYPYGAFTTLLGALPPSKATRAGLRLRIVTLRRAGLEWDEYFDHDSLDALAAALTGCRFQQGLATPVGDPREGLIWLPVPRGELRDSYATL